MTLPRLRLALARVLGRIERARYVTVGGDDLADLMVRVGNAIYPVDVPPAWTGPHTTGTYTYAVTFYDDTPPATCPPGEYAPAARCDLSMEDHRG